jgi:hypothetical protein
MINRLIAPVIALSGCFKPQAVVPEDPPGYYDQITASVCASVSQSLGGDSFVKSVDVTPSGACVVTVSDDAGRNAATELRGKLRNQMVQRVVIKGWDCDLKVSRDQSEVAFGCHKGQRKPCDPTQVAGRRSSRPNTFLYRCEGEVRR